MPIQEITPLTGPRLQHIGIHVQSAQASQTSTPATAETQIDQAERLTLAGLQLQHFEQAYVVVSGASTPPLVIDPRQLNSGPLVTSLQQIGRRLDLDTALDLHAAASSLIASMRQQGELPQQGSLKLFLSGAFGEIELDLDRLQPEALRTAFNSSLQEQPRQDLQSIHSQLSSLSQLVRAGFGAGDDPGQLAEWIEGVMAPEFELTDFLNQTLGYNPLNQESSVRYLLQSMQAAPAEAKPEQPGDSETLEQLLHEKSNALVEAANRLEAQLELAPTPDSPDILDLLRSFQAILRQLDHDLTQILVQQNQHKQFERKVLGQFAERLHRNLNFHKEQLDKLHQSHHARIQLLLQQLQLQAQAKLWLITQ